MSKLNINEVEINGVVYVEKESVQAFAPKMAGDFCIVRTYSAGVFAGNIDISEIEGKVGDVSNAIRIFYWDGAASLSQLALEGVNKPGNCKFALPVATVHLTEIIEVIPCTAAAFNNIKAVPSWKQ